MRYVLKQGVWFKQPHAVIGGVPIDARAIVYDVKTAENGKPSRWHYLEIHKAEVHVPCLWDETRVRIRTKSEVWEFEVYPMMNTVL